MYFQFKQTSATLVYIFKIKFPVRHQGRIQDFHLRGGAHHEREAPNPLYALDVLSCYLSLINFKHSDTKWDLKKYTVDQILGGGCCAPPPPQKKKSATGLAHNTDLRFAFIIVIWCYQVFNIDGLLFIIALIME